MAVDTFSGQSVAISSVPNWETASYVMIGNVRQAGWQVLLTVLLAFTCDLAWSLWSLVLNNAAPVRIEEIFAELSLQHGPAPSLSLILFKRSFSSEIFQINLTSAHISIMTTEKRAILMKNRILIYSIKG